MAIETMETDLRTAQTIIDAAGVTIPTGNLSPTKKCHVVWSHADTHR